MSYSASLRNTLCSQKAPDALFLFLQQIRSFGCTSKVQREQESEESKSVVFELHSIALRGLRQTPRSVGRQGCFIGANQDWLQRGGYAAMVFALCTSRLFLTFMCCRVLQ